MQQFSWCASEVVLNDLGIVWLRHFSGATTLELLKLAAQVICTLIPIAGEPYSAIMTG